MSIYEAGEAAGLKQIPYSVKSFSCFIFSCCSVDLPSSHISKRLYLLSFYTYKGICLRICLSTTCVSGAHGVQKMALNHLQLELQIVVSCHVGAGVEPRSSTRAVT